MRSKLALICALCICTAAFSACASNDSSKTDSSAVSSSDSEKTKEPEFELDPTPISRTENVMPALDTVKEQYAEKESETASLIEELSKQKEKPCINITTENGDKIKSKDTYTASVIDVFNCDEAYRLSAAGGVKVRGNSSADQGDEKPYRIKFEQKQNMLGLHDGNEYKSWVLLRSYWNLGTDYMAQKLAKGIFEGKYYNTDVMYVNLYINGDYKGIYVLCEQNQPGKGRVEVNEPKDDDTSADIGYMLEIDNYPDDSHPYFVMDYEQAEIEDISGEKRQFVSAEYSLKSEINTQGQLDFIENYTRGVYKILYEAAINNTALCFDSAYNVVPADGINPQEAVEAVIDTESLANMLILEELVHNYDVGEGSFYMARDFSEGSKYEKLTFMAPWDFNWSYEGSPSGKYYACTFQPEVGEQDRSNPWLITAIKADWFKDIVKTKWVSLVENNTLQEAIKTVQDDSAALENDLGEDAWKIEKVYDLMNFVYGRIDWLNKEWK